MSVKSTSAPFPRKEFIGEAQINVTEYPVDVVYMSRALADIKTAQKIEDPYMLVSLDSLYDQYKLWSRELPQIQPFYAVKCNVDETILRCLASLGVGFDCASRGEIDDVLRLGVSPSRIVYAHPCKSPAYIEHASDVGVDLMTFDNVEELDKIAAHHPSAQLLLRIAVDDSTARSQFSSKFGADPVKARDASALLKYAAVFGLRVTGVSFHVGSWCNDPSSYRVALRHTKNLFEIGRSFGHRMHVVDIGGGFPGRETHTPFKKFASVIRSAIDELFREYEDVRFIAEPGRFFVERSTTLVSNVIGRTAVPANRITKKDSDANAVGYMYYANDGVYGDFICVIADDYYAPGRPLFDEKGPLYPSTIWGPTLDSRDRLESNKLMRKLNVGDWILYEDMGAYTTGISTSFNGFPRPAMIYICSQLTWNDVSVSAQNDTSRHVQLTSSS